MQILKKIVLMCLVFVFILSTVYAVYIPVKGNPANYVDISEHWAYDSMKYVIENGYFNGVTKNEFRPDDEMSRAMLVTVLWRLTGDDLTWISSSGKRTPRYVNMFWDMKDDEWYTNYISWANKNDIINGYSKREFRPNDSITREQLAVVLYNYLKNYKLVRNLNTMKTCEPVTFIDNDSISEWARDKVSMIQQIGLMEGKSDGSFSPNDKITRAEASIIIQRLDSII